MSSSSNTLNILINSKSKWYKELFEICSQGYSVKGNSTFPVNIDVMIQCRPKQIVCIINGRDLLFEWKRNKQFIRIKNVAKYFKHSYVIIIIKHDLELQKINKLFNSDKYLKNSLEINIEIVYFQDLNEAVRFFGFIASKTLRFNKKSNCNTNRNNDENKENETMTNLWLNDNNNRIIDILTSIEGIEETEALAILNSDCSLSSIKGIANKSSNINNLGNMTYLDLYLLQQISRTFNNRLNLR